MRVPGAEKYKAAEALYGDGRAPVNCRKFLPNFATISEPLTRLTKQGLKYEWSEEQQLACDAIKQQVKVEQRGLPGFVGKRVDTRPWQIVAGDMMRPLPKSMHGHEYILVIQNLFTRWIECVPVRRANANTVLRELKKSIFYRYDVPEVFLSDNGTEVKNRVVGNFLREQGIRHEFTPPYHPQANPVERVNRSRKTMIVAFIEANHRACDEHLEEEVFAINMAEHSATGVSLARLNYGRQPTKPSSARRQQDIAAAEQEQRDAFTAWLELMDGLGALRELAAENVKES